VRVYSASEREKYAGTRRSDDRPSAAVRRKIDHIMERTDRHTV
jgi:hypothetical protein